MEPNSPHTVKTGISDIAENFTDVNIITSTSTAIKNEYNNSQHDYQPQDFEAQESTQNAASHSRHKSLKHECSSSLDGATPKAEKFNWSAALERVRKIFGSPDLMDVKIEVKSEDMTCPLVNAEPHTSSHSNQLAESGNIDTIIGSTEPTVEVNVAAKDIHWPLEEPHTSSENTVRVDSDQTYARVNIEQLNGTYSCPQCYSTFSHWILLQRHRYKQHSLVQRVCNEVTERDVAISTHTERNEENRTSRTDRSTHSGTNEANVTRTNIDDISNNYVSFSQDEHFELCKLKIPAEAKPFQCNICSKSFSGRNTLLKHECIHSGGAQFKCGMRYVSEESSLVSHMKSLTKEKQFQCHVCNKCFSERGTLVQHLRIYTEANPFQCDVCNICFSQKCHLVRHMRIHTEQKPFQCDVCKKYFSQKYHLVTHMRIHTKEKPFQCVVCKKCFSRSSILVTHMRIHTEEKPFQCVVCNKCFSQKGTLVKHMRVHTEEKPFQCDVCKECFSQKCTLVQHMRIHTKEKPFQCVVCKKCFSHSSNLVPHMRIHTKEKPFQCDVCNKYFSESGTLVRHMRIHTEEKPFQCVVCKKCFSHSSNLVKHMRIHTKEPISMRCL